MKEKKTSPVGKLSAMDSFWIITKTGKARAKNCASYIGEKRSG